MLELRASDVSVTQSTFALGCVIGVAHCIFCCVLGFLAFAGAMGQALSDGPESASSIPNILALIVGILEAPVALIQWAVIKAHPQTNTGLDFQTLFLIACVWSAVFGWISAVLYKKLKKPRC